MLDPETLAKLRQEVAYCVVADRTLLDDLLKEIAPLEHSQHRIHPRSTTSVSMVGTDGGNNEFRFDPFLVQIIRIVDSNRNELWLEVVTPTTPTAEPNSRHFENGRPISPLGRMMEALDVRSVGDLSFMLRDGTPDKPRSPSWINVYREVTEWAVLLDMTKKEYGSDTLIIFDGFLRSKVFKGTLFKRYGELLAEAIEKQILKNARHGVVLDPFCGRGTTNLAARVRGLPTVGIDSSPVAVAATAAKLSRGATSVEDIVGLARTLIAEHRDPEVPQGAFWDLAYHPDVLRQICSIREGLRQSHLSGAARALRGLMLGALHGPKHKNGSSSYLSNQSPRTYGPKPKYAVRFWEERGLRPPIVDVVKVIDARAKRAFGGALQPVRSRVCLGDSRSISWSDVLRNIGSVRHVVTSPPYYGLRTYRPDQWLREWFLGGSDEVCYTAESQVGHRSPESFAADLAVVWTRLAKHVAADARMVVRFGAINDRPVEPASIIRASILPTPWRIVHMRKAGLASSGRRQAVSFREMIPPPVEELDVYCRLAA